MLRKHAKTFENFNVYYVCIIYCMEQVLQVNSVHASIHKIHVYVCVGGSGVCVRVHVCVHCG